ncbi:hypothetical protein FO519_007582 [Halicephalobus sp. NKZ332]|nr:hypothetical protein FO519_007582 [Halicephalobus sp. NKZ332]
MAPIPSTSESPWTSSTPSTPLPKRRHHRVRPSAPEEVIDIFNSTAGSTSQAPYFRKNHLDERARTGPYGTNLFAKGTQYQTQDSLAGIFVLIFVMIGIILVMVLFYFLAKVCSNPPESTKRKVKTKKGTVVIRENKNSMDVGVVTTTVPLPKRIYELKAEEGYYTCPPAIDNSLDDIFGDGDEDFFTSPASSRSQHSEEKNSQKQKDILSERKLTGYGLPPGFKPKGRLQELKNGGM